SASFSTSLLPLPAPTKQPNDKIVARHGHTLERPLDVPVEDLRAGPAIDERMHNPDNQKGKYAGEDDIRRKMRSGHDPGGPHHSSQCERRTIGERTPLRWCQRGRGQCPGRARHVSRDESAVGRTVAARIPPGHKLLVASEL